MTAGTVHYAFDPSSRRWRALYIACCCLRPPPYSLPQCRLPVSRLFERYASPICLAFDIALLFHILRILIFTYLVAFYVYIDLTIRQLLHAASLYAAPFLLRRRPPLQPIRYRNTPLDGSCLSPPRGFYRLGRASRDD